MQDLIKDFTVVVGPRKLRTNRACLEKHSDYFKAMFSSGMRESLTKSVKLQNVDEDLMCQIIDFCERGARISVSESNAMRILATGMMLQMEVLKSSAEQFLVRGLNLTNVVDLFDAADYYGSSSLRNSCAKFICWSFDEFVDTLTPTNFELVHYILLREYSHSNEDLILKAVLHVIGDCSVEKAQELFDCLYAHNVTLQNEVFNLYRSVGPARRGYRKDSSTLAVVLENKDAFYFDRRSSKFVKFTTLPVQVVGYGLVAHRQYWYLVGGQDRIGVGKWNKIVYRYDFLLNSWEHFAEMPDCRRSSTVIVSNNRLLVFGGFGKFRKSLQGELIVLDLESRTWQREDLKFHRTGLGQQFKHAPWVLKTSLASDFIFREKILPLMNLSSQQIKTTLPLGGGVVLITCQNDVFFCNLASKSVDKLALRNSAITRPDFVTCHIVDRSLFNVKMMKVTEYLIDIEAFTLTEMKTYRMIEETSDEKINSSCTAPYF